MHWLRGLWEPGRRCIHWNRTVVHLLLLRKCHCQCHCICVFPNQKPWMMDEVRLLIRARDAALRTRDRPQNTEAKANLKRGIRSANDMYRKKIEGQLGDNNPRQMWQGIQNITYYKGTDSTTINTDASLAEKLNSFFARFEAHRPMAPSSIQQNLTHPSATWSGVGTQPRAAGPDRCARESTCCMCGSAFRDPHHSPQSLPVPLSQPV